MWYASRDMLIYAGIDEAGYGPMLGPFVVSRAIFALDGHDGDTDPPCLWKKLKKAVCRQIKDRRRRIAVNDSKKLYTPAAGLTQLERGVLAFAHLAGYSAATLDQLLAAFCDDDESRVPDQLWYADEAGGPAVPHDATAGQVSIAAATLRRCAEAEGFAVRNINAAIIYEKRFNELCESDQSKAVCAWRYVSRHMRYVWDHYGEHHPRVVVDRQGGRKVYHGLIQELLPAASVRLQDESDDISRYYIEEGGRRMTVSFEVESEQRHMPVAVASMTAKYLRELLMTRFNHFFLQHAPELRPTAGYYGDGRRFIQEIEPVIAALGIDRHSLIRVR